MVAPALTSPAQMAGVARWDVRPRLHELAGLEVTIVHGADDVLMDPRHSQELARIIPGARLFMIPGCGHLLTTEAKEPVARIVREHLARVARPSSQPA